jgi:hypothetical protein
MDSKYKCQQKKDKRTINDLQNTTQKTKDQAVWTDSFELLVMDWLIYWLICIVNASDQYFSHITTFPINKSEAVNHRRTDQWANVQGQKDFNYDLQNTTQKTKDRATRTSLNTYWSWSLDASHRYSLMMYLVLPRYHYLELTVLHKFFFQ